MENTTTEIDYAHFACVEMRVGTIITAVPFAKARHPAYQLTIDFGVQIGVKRSSAQITTHYTCTQLIDRQIVAVINFPVKQIANFFSECLVLGAIQPDGSVILLAPDSGTSNGDRIL